MVCGWFVCLSFMLDDSVFEGGLDYLSVFFEILYVIIVVIEGKVVLILGVLGIGKLVFVFELMSCGVELVVDDCIIVFVCVG